ncbi:Inhibin beta A chain [Harpegnathos saltator]|uniref:Inhibin beta A chain n=2 Tax=Harpegnathos saltator TaxID=610380 RepID=E2C3B4_HARSA|nr:Inhibin beta A chain [Harpegnathos saltator]
MRLFIVFAVIFGTNNAFVLSAWPEIPSFMTNMLTSSSRSTTPAPPSESYCPSCAQNKIVINNDPLTEQRVEYVKQQILKKLRLSKPPEVLMPLSTLPKPLINGNVLELRPGAPLVPDKPAESFYGKTDQVIVFPREDATAGVTKYCQSSNHLGRFNAACFTFYLPNEMQFVDVTSAQLWFYKEYDENDYLNQTFVLSELDHWDQGGSFEKNTVMAIFETDIGEGWVEANVDFIVKKWVNRRRLKHTIQIVCNTCSDNRNTVPVSVKMTLKPFLVIHTAPLPQRNRPKRNSNCQPDMKECCRDELYINFQDIGWSDWILHPSGYHAYFCRGSCSSAASLTLSGTGHNNIIMKWLSNKGNEVPRKNEIVPCCSPTQLAPIQLLYIDTNNTITQKTLPNMVVEACGCM